MDVTAETPEGTINLISPATTKMMWEEGGGGKVEEEGGGGKVEEEEGGGEVEEEGRGEEECPLGLYSTKGEVTL